MEALRSDNYESNNQRAATDCAKSRASKPASTIKMVKRTIGNNSEEEEEVHDVRRGIVNMAMNDAQET